MLQHEKGLFTFRLFGPCWLHTRAVGTGRVAGCICPPPDSSRSVNPISTMRGRFCPLQRYYPGFSDLPSALPTQSSPSPSNVSTLSISHIYFGMCVAYIAKGGNAIHWTSPLLSLLLHAQGRRNDLCSHCETICIENLYNSYKSQENMSSYFGLIDGITNRFDKRAISSGF